MHQVSKPRSANHSIAEECGRPGTCRSKVGCEAIDEPCTNRIVPRGPPAAEGLCQRKSLMSPFLVQCSVPFIGTHPSSGNRPSILCKNPAAHVRLRRRLDEHRYRDAGYVSEAADAPCTGARWQAGDPREGPWHLADLDLGALRRRGAVARLRARRARTQAWRP